MGVKARVMFLALVLLSLVCGLYGQSYITRETAKGKALKHFEGGQSALAAGQPVEAIKSFGKALEAEPQFIDAYLQLARMYYRTGDLEQAIAALENAVTIDSMYQPDALRSLSNLNREMLNLDVAIPQLLAYRNMVMSDQAEFLAVEQDLQRLYVMQELVGNPVDFDPAPLPAAINSEVDEALPLFTVDGQTMIFTRRAGRREELYYSGLREDGSWTAAIPLPDFAAPGNTGAHSISADGRILAFTGCGWPNGEGSCDIYVTGKLPDGTWRKPVNFRNINSAGWDGQPALSPDGRTIYFSSDRQGVGQRDLWYASFAGDSWSDPMPLGLTINTAGNESSPFIHFDDRTLYFMSDGRPGMGDYDLYVTRRDDQGEWSIPENLGYPVNTPLREGALTIHPDGIQAFFTRENSKNGRMDIYKFDLDSARRPTPVSYARGVIVDAQSGNPLIARVSIFDATHHGESKYLQSDASGEFLVGLPHGGTYGVHVEKSGFTFHSETFALDHAQPFTAYELAIELFPVDTTAVSDSDPVILRNIHFASGSASLTEASEFELVTLAKFLTSNPEAQITVRGHTDNVGDPVDNLQLSAERAAKVCDWLEHHGIAPSRLDSEGLGESEPVASNDTEEGRALNRRTDFIVRSGEQ